MKIRDYLDFGKAENKYDIAIRMCYLIFFSIGFIVFFAVGLLYMLPEIWLLTFVCCVFGSVIFSVIAKGIINIMRKDQQKDKKSKADLIQRLINIFIFAMAAVACITIGIEESGGDIKYWIITFVGSCGGAVILSAIVRVIFAFAKKDN